MQDAAAAPQGRLSLILRLAIALAASAAAAIGVERVLEGPIELFAARALLSAAAAAALVGLALWQLVVVPISRSSADLQKRYQAALADSLSDPLTGLGNHRAFQEELERQVEAANRYDMPLALVMLDLDEFKQVNDRNGHADGDRTLAYFGRLMANAVRRADRPFRIGGDEFAILLPHTDAEGARIVARRVLADALSPTLRHEGQPRSPISFSAGISAMPDLAVSRAQLYSQADAALYRAKHGGRTDVVLFDPTSAPATADAAEVGPQVAEVIARGLLHPVYQPIVELATGRVLGMEGLIRPVAPAPFADPGSLFAAARASGHLVELDLSCFEAIVAGSAGLDPVSFLSINISPATVQAPDFSATALLSILARHNVPPGLIVLELTEREEIADLAKVRVRLEACRRGGMRLAVDDVGAGNAGLRLLSELRFDIIKVDLGLIQRSASSVASSAVIESVVSFAARTGALIVGEGIEEQSQVSRLTSLGVTAGQGFLYGRPEPRPVTGSAEARHTNAVPVAMARRPHATEIASPMNSWRQSIGLPVA